MPTQTSVPRSDPTPGSKHVRTRPPRRSSPSPIDRRPSSKASIPNISGNGGGTREDRDVPSPRNELYLVFVVEAMLDLTLAGDSR